MKIILLIVTFFLIAAFFIITENNLHLSDEEELREFNSLYMDWLGNMFENLKQSTAYVVKIEWLPNPG